MTFFADIYDWYHRRLGWRVCERITGRRTAALLSEMRAFDELRLEARAAALDNALADTLRAAAETPFYASRIPGDLASPREALRQVPVTRKEDIRSDPRAFLSRNCRRLPKTTRTAGSTGQPLETYCDPVTPECGTAAMAYARNWWGIAPGARALNLWGHSKYLSGGFQNALRLSRRRWMDRVLNRTVFPAYDLGPERLAQFARLVQRRRPCYLLGYASAIHAAAMAFEGAVPPELKAVISTGEVLYEWQQHEIEERLGVPVIQEYGMCEASIIAYSCPSSSNHVLDSVVHVELLDEADRPVALGETGRIVVTLLRRHTVPLIRYDTGDMAAEVQQGCPCGHAGRLIGRVQGRTYDLIRTPSGCTVPGVLFTHAMKYVKDVERYTIVQKTLHRIEIRYEQQCPISAEDLALAQKKMEEVVGPNVEFCFMAVDALPREGSGKFRWIRSEIPSSESASVGRQIAGTSPYCLINAMEVMESAPDVE